MTVCGSRGTIHISMLKVISALMMFKVCQYEGKSMLSMKIKVGILR